ncbi:MAG: lipoprotein signal peptidase [Bacteroidales bacterium]|nr:lipoprotein signal peptidase [Bacteroidales bacterium]
MLIVVLILIFDQFLKIWIKTHMHLGEEISIFDDWFYIHFTENEGMAFGYSFGGEFGKLFLSIFRIFAVLGIGGYIYYQVRSKAKNGYIISLSLIMAGAIGNIIDSALYGMIFNASSYHSEGVAKMFPEEGGYASFLHGKVVDMFFFPLYSGNYPDWLPFIGGNHFLFFSPVFNIADAAITTGVLMILFFQKRYFVK